ncbi:ALP1-like protein [Tanacetum coccineum]
MSVSWQGTIRVVVIKKYPTIMLEVVASQDLWIWHAFFGVAGANNDINVLDNSSLFDDLLNDKAPVAPYVVNGVGYEKGYYLADGIYPQWATFVKSFTVANDAKHAYFKKRQESARKDVERAFGVLQGRWGIIQQQQQSIPISYQKYLVSRRKNKTAILKRGCRKWHVKIDNDWVFGEGWEAFVRDNGVQDFDFVVFKHQGNMVFDTMVFDTSSCEREYPIHKARRACLEKKSYGKCKTDTDVLKKTPKVKDTYINISLKSEKYIIPDHNNHPYFIGTLKASSKKLITKIERIRDILTFEENTLT